MKYIYTLLLSLIVFNQTLAENWVKYSVTVNDMIVPGSYPCHLFNGQSLDSIDLDCSSLMKEITFSLERNVHLQESEIYNLLRYYPNLESINFGFNKQIDSFYIEKLPDNIKKITLSKIQRERPLISIEGEKIKSVEISTSIKELTIYKLPENIQHIFISDDAEMTGGHYDTLNLIMSSWPTHLKTFDCERTLSYCNESFPPLLENFGTRYTYENREFIDQLLNKNSNLPHFNLLTLYSNNDLNDFDLSPIDHIKKLRLAIPYNHYLGDGNFWAYPYPKDLEYLELDRVFVSNEAILATSVKSMHLKNLNAFSYIYELPESLDTLRVTNAEEKTELPPFPKNLVYLELHNLPNLTCLPSLPNTLRNLKKSQIGIQCLPNETPWVYATEEWPLCVDASKICDLPDEYIITGSVFIDANANQAIDTEDIIAKDYVVEANGIYSSSFKNGKFYLLVQQPGEYVLKLTPNYNNLVALTPERVQSILTSNKKNDTVNFLIQLQPETDVEIIGSNTVARPGMHTELTAFIKNRNILPAKKSTVKILTPSDWEKYKIIPEGYIISNDTIVWDNIDILSFGEQYFNIASTLPPTATILGDAYQYQMWVENEDDISPENNYYSIIDTIIGSYDPNDKIVNHSSLTPELSNSKELIYTIRFQNTGTDTAFKVVIIDTIIGNLEPSSIRVIGASHNYIWDFTGQGIATFVFDNILLPDSNINEPGSHGFVTLALRPSKDLVVGDSIYNRASIYFDFNESVITNHANTKIATVTPVYSHSNIPLSIYPNPAKNQVRVEWNVTERAILRLTDISGKVIRTERLNNGFTDINVSQLPKGLYIIQLQAGQDMAVSKLIVQ